MCAVVVLISHGYKLIKNLLVNRITVHPQIMPPCKRIAIGGTLLWFFIYVNSWCTSRCDLRPNCFPQKTHTWNLRSAQERVCWQRFAGVLNIFLQIPQWNCLSCKWRRLCWSRLPLCENVLAHMLHLCGFWLVWVRICVCSVDNCLKDLLQRLQKNGLLSVWIPVWVFKFTLVGKDLLQYSQLNGLSKVCRKICLSKSDLVLNNFPQNTNSWDLTSVWILRWEFKFLRRDVM